tara:strand:+ start:38 stop:379 length:342 start_codon:yes stop_codon:yes gene_type:complete
MKYASDIEKKVVDDLLSVIFKHPSNISLTVSDGEEMVISQPTREIDLIKSELCQTECNVLKLWAPVPSSPEVLRKVGSYVLIWGNDCDLISDSSMSDLIDEIDSQLKDFSGDC